MQLEDDGGCQSKAILPRQSVGGSSILAHFNDVSGNLAASVSSACYWPFSNGSPTLALVGLLCARGCRLGRVGGFSKADVYEVSL